MRKLHFSEREERLEAEQAKVLQYFVNYNATCSVLDVGCANIRRYSQQLLSVADLYVGLELEWKQLKGLSENNNYRNNASLINANAEKMPFLDSSFDVVVMNDMLAYCDKVMVLKEAARVLRPGGLAISLHNNSVGWSIYKMRYPEKPPILEWLHSLVVMGNTLVYRATGYRLFHTTFNSRYEIEGIMRKVGLDIEKSWSTRDVYHWYHVLGKKPLH